MSTVSLKNNTDNNNAAGNSPGSFTSPLQYTKAKKGGEEEKAVNVQVAVRCRPLNKKELGAGEECVISCNESRREVKVVATNERAANMIKKFQSKSFIFDKVFGMQATQEDVYEAVCKPIVDEVLNGYNCTVFAYGQTGTGKTHTMEGERDAKDGLTFDAMNIKELQKRCPPTAGVIPRAIRHIFHHLQAIHAEYTVRVSYLELYNEQLTDLLGIEGNDVEMRIYEDPQKGTFVAGLEEVPVCSEEEIFSILEKSAAKRRTAETLMNKYSSRSHSIFSITIHIKESTPEGEDLLKVGKLNLVDLAGSENIGRSGAQNMRAREAGNINQSLLTLGRVITSLVEHHPHIPYRDSKLTRLLQESLGGRNKTCIIATICPDLSSLDETLSTLDYACRAKNIKNRPTVNQMMTKRALIKEYTDEIARLKAELEATRSKNGVYLPNDMYEKLMASQAMQSDAIENLESKVGKTEEKLEQMRSLLESTKTELEHTKEKLHTTEHSLQRTKEKLIETKRHLKKVMKERDEKEFLLKCHTETEDRLHRQATELKGSLEESLEDIQRLFQKIQRKQSIEDHNIQAASEFAQRSQSTVSSLQVNSQQYQQEHMKRYRMAEKEVDEFVMEQKKQVTKILQRTKHLLDEANKGFQSMKTASDEYSQQYNERQDTFTTTFQNNMSHLQNIFEQLLQTFEQDTSSIETNIHDNIEHINQFAQQSLHHWQQQNESVQTFLNKQIEHFHVIVASLVAENDKQKERLAKSDQIIEHNMSVQNDLLVKAKATAMRSIEDALQTLVSTSQAAHSQTVTETKEALSACSNGLDGMQQHLREQMSQAESNIEGFRQETTNNKTKIEQQVNGAIQQQVEKENDVLHKTHLSRHHLKQGMNDAEEKRREQSQLFEAFRKDTEQFLQSHLKQQATLSENASQQSSTCKDAVEQEIQTGLDKNMKAATLVKEGLSKEQNSLQEFSRQQGEDVDRISSSVDELMTFGLRVDEPTSFTPRKRQWHYPQAIEKTVTHEELLKTFYASYQDASCLSDEYDGNDDDVLVQSKLPNGTIEKGNKEEVSSSSCLERQSFPEKIGSESTLDDSNKENNSVDARFKGSLLRLPRVQIRRNN
eukprot:jgi/Galph1/4169/GphlegSOOS_G2797.1